MQTKMTAFHAKFGFPIGESLDVCDNVTATEQLRTLGHNLSQLSEMLRIFIARGIDDLRMQRVQLMLEELGELISALAVRNETEAVDGAGDLLYTVIGTMTAFNWPALAIFDEVHRSNMTKTPGGHKPAKGPHFSPPDFTEILE